ncbi:hypothetical protein M5689_013682 [Euphorbia peplus]|nr:hypothetical protein M5689_013682 [Euphorbia peplus]
MDLKFKGMTWVGNIYQRLEIICHEVDNIVNQDAVKYVENQVQLVGESMKKVCSDVVQIVEPVRCEAQAVALKGNAVVGTYIKSIIGREREQDRGHVVPTRQPYLEPTDFASTNVFDEVKIEYHKTVPTPWESHQGTELDLEGTIGVVSTNEKCSAPEALDLTASLETDSTNSLQSHELINNDNENSHVSLHGDSSSASVNGKEDSLPSQEVVESYGDVGNEDSYASDYSGSSVSSASPPSLSSNKEEEGTELTFSNSVLPVELTDTFISLPSPIDSYNNGEAKTGLSFSDSVISLESTECSSCSTYVVDFGADSQMETIDLLDNLKLEESCVIVDNTMLYDVARRIQRHRSYKKKIQDAFSTRKRVSKEYEQLTIWYGELDTESSQDINEPPSNPVVLDPPDIEEQNSLDSEWELL